jgi:3',5'-cyclic AMP phosphodiesterase CpdA
MSLSQPTTHRVLRIAHLTDIHIYPEPRAIQGLTACLRHVHALADPPDVIFNGGDAIMDALEIDEERTRAQWDVWQQILRAECRLPIEHCLGNHDVWGWHRAHSGTTGREPRHGKKWALEVFGLAAPYRSFDQAGWHFIVLDSTYPHGHDYLARLDAEQFAWLEADLNAVPRQTPVLVLSHIPILSACVFFDGDNETPSHWVVPGAWVHLDARRLKDLFLQHPNVKLCLSGHVHLHERVDYNGVTYLCNGAVCGDWWRGPYQECAPGYGLIDLYADGSFAHQYLTWEETATTEIKGRY